MDNLQFRISSALKDLIGRELITDEFVAVFELVKNSFDANATMVQLAFENLNDPKKAKIVIKDNGCGMNLDDIQKKWLFVGYSEKKIANINTDYRQKLSEKRVFAGAKGVGRFSCDRLGTLLNVFTRKNDTEDSSLHHLKIDWTSFETNSETEFVDVMVEHEVSSLKDSPLIDEYGTILEISNLRDVWTRKRLLELKNSLEKLINPIQDNDADNFSIEIIADDERLEDLKHKVERERVNGKIRNFVFEALGLKTTQIQVSIDPEGQNICTSLLDRGIPIFSLKERNVYHNLYNINIVLFVLNRAGKLTFNKIMGMPSVQYGSVFIYKNGFRIYPFGEEGDDTLKIDRRKQQGFYRYIGTRDLIGRIEINGEKSNLKETTSRDGGLVKNDSYNQLIDLFYDKALKRLENYAVGIIKWGDERFDKDGELIQSELRPEDVKDKIIDIITNLTKAQDVIDIEYNHDFVQIYEQKQIRSVSRLANNFVKIAERTNNDTLIHEARILEKSVNALKNAKDEAELESEKIKKEQRENEELIKQVKTENLFLMSDVNSDIAQLTSLNHHITHTSNAIEEFLLLAIDAIRTGNNGLALEYLNDIYEENQKIATISNYVSKARFDTKITKIDEDIIKFVKEYLLNVYARMPEGLKVSINELGVQTYKLRFSPIDMIMVLDNLLNNSQKAYKGIGGSRKVNMTWILKDRLQLIYRDFASGISNEVLPHVFEYRYSTTGGGGLGMYHVKEILSRMNASIDVNNNVDKGVEFIITF